MEGIKIFDSATIMSIWKAAKLETAEIHPSLKKGSQEYWEHIEGRVNEIVNKTQPTYDLTNRAEMSASSNPILRVLTMFSSARSKVAMLMVDGVISYVNNPTQANKSKLIKRSANILITTSLVLTAIDALKSRALYGLDDDELPEFVLNSTITNNLGYFYGLSTLTQLVVSQMDDKPWHRTVQHPVEMLIQDVSHALAHLFKGNLNDALLKSIEAVFKTKGLPLQAEVVPKALWKQFNEEI
jgi:hypothetical protein